MNPSGHSSPNQTQSKNFPQTNLTNLTKQNFLTDRRKPEKRPNEAQNKKSGEITAAANLDRRQLARTHQSIGLLNGDVKNLADTSQRQKAPNSHKKSRPKTHTSALNDPYEPHRNFACQSTLLPRNSGNNPHQPQQAGKITAASDLKASKFTASNQGPNRRIADVEFLRSLLD